ncbi:MAG: caspase family protein [Candidatus Kapaibacterium sp.]
MKRGVSLHIGVNRVDLSRYSKSTEYRELFGCDDDAFAMSMIAKRLGYESRQTMLNEEATFKSVADAIRLIAEENKLIAGDTFLITFSGHGDHITNPARGPEAYSECWVLHDMVMKDKYINSMLTLFDPGVRVILVSDSCRSAGIPNPEVNAFTSDFEFAFRSEWDLVSRALPQEMITEHYQEYAAEYEGYDAEYDAIADRKEVRASVAVLAACTRDQPAFELPTGGIFTKHLLEVLSRGGEQVGDPYTGGYNAFVKLIKNRLGGRQEPSFTAYGNTKDVAFFDGDPFVRGDGNINPKGLTPSDSTDISLKSIRGDTLVNTEYSFVPANNSLLPSGATLQVTSPAPDVILSAGTNQIEFRADVSNFTLGFVTETPFPCIGAVVPTKGDGQHIYVVIDRGTAVIAKQLDNGKDNIFVNPTPGLHTLRAYLSRSWFESLKNGASANLETDLYCVRTFYIESPVNIGGTIDSQKPLLTLNSPVKGAAWQFFPDEVIIDFYIMFAHLSPNLKVRAALLDENGVEIHWQYLTEWRPYCVRGIPTPSVDLQKYFVNVRLVDAAGDNVVNGPGNFNDVTQEFVVRPRPQIP